MLIIIFVTAPVQLAKVLMQRYRRLLLLLARTLLLFQRKHLPWRWSPRLCSQQLLVIVRTMRDNIPLRAIWPTILLILLSWVRLWWTTIRRQFFQEWSLARGWNHVLKRRRARPSIQLLDSRAWWPVHKLALSHVRSREEIGLRGHSLVLKALNCQSIFKHHLFTEGIFIAAWLEKVSHHSQVIRTLV